MNEKRAVLRRRTYHEARLSSQDGIAWAHGVVRNLSEGGALVDSVSGPIPDALDIQLPQTGFRSRARVVWREGPRAGLQFEASPVRVVAPPPLATPYDDDPNY